MAVYFGGVVVTAIVIDKMKAVDIGVRKGYNRIALEIALAICIVIWPVAVLWSALRKHLTVRQTRIIIYSAFVASYLIWRQFT